MKTQPLTALFRSAKFIPAAVTALAITSWAAAGPGEGATNGGPEAYELSVVAAELASPTGIVAVGTTYVAFTEVPTPGVAGVDGGSNGVKSLNVHNGRIQTLSAGEPEPVNLALDHDRTLYWTCKTAGVILANPYRGVPELFIDGLTAPNGIAIAPQGEVLFTELLSPGISGDNAVAVTDGNAVTVISSVEPAPTDIVVGADGVAYWTCRSAGVIVRRSAAGVITLLLDGLNAPTGIALDRFGDYLFFTETPTPGVAGSEGGENRVVKVDLETLEQYVINEGDPEPTDVTVALNGRVYWTCTSAGVIVCARPVGNN